MKKAQIAQKFNLDRINDWSTIQIIKEILNTDNQDILISDKPNSWIEADAHDPQPIEQMVPQIQELFKQGHQLILSMIQNQGDEGGTLYLAYLVKPEYQKQFWNDYDNTVVLPSPQPNPGFFHASNYIAAHPEQFTEIWAGAY